MFQKYTILKRVGVLSLGARLLWEGGRLHRRFAPLLVSHLRILRPDACSNIVVPLRRLSTCAIQSHNETRESRTFISQLVHDLFETAHLPSTPG